MKLYDYQWDAINRMHNGSILCGGVGSGKSLTSLAYYFTEIGKGYLNGTEHGFDDDYVPMCEYVDLYIITTARKRDTKEWEGELGKILMSTNQEVSLYSTDIEIHIDSWNNIGKYIDVQNAFFIFDEQRVVGSGAWVKSFLKITQKNKWILLSATPGDTWTDYIPVFIANGFYRNRTEFNQRHVVFKRFSKFPQVERYLETNRLIRLRDCILVTMDYIKPTTSHNDIIPVEYDRFLYKEIMSTRWNIFENEPIKNAAELCFTARKVVNSDPSRVNAIIDILKDHPKIIVFYNYDYELDILKKTSWGKDVKISEWNGHKHQPIPKSESWIYLVQYNAGAEGWNCIETDTMIFYSMNYSYKIMVQSAGRIDRMNTPFTDLYYYQLRSNCPLDIAISRALKTKKNFNERKFFAL